MKTFLNSIPLALAVNFVLALGQANASIVYSVNESFGGGSITGTVTTDGTLGTISTISPFIDWNLTLSDGTNSSGLNSSNSFLYDVGQSFRWSSTATDLTFDHTFGQYFLFFANDYVSFWCLEGPADGCAGYPGTSNFMVNVNGSRSALVTDVQPNTVFTAQNSVPEPGTLASVALGLLGIAASRKRRML